MSTINKKEFGWAKSRFNSLLVIGSIFGFFGLLPLAVKTGLLYPYAANPSYTVSFNDIFYLFVWLSLSVGAFIDFFWMRKMVRKTSYIKITNDGIHISPTSFLLRAKDIKWKNISKIKKIRKNKRSVPYMMTLSLLTAKDIKIGLNILNLDDRNSLIQIIKETIENKTTA